MRRGRERQLGREKRRRKILLSACNALE